MKIITDLADANREAVLAAAAVLAVGLVVSLLSSRLSRKTTSKASGHKECLKPASTLPVLGNLLDVVKNQHRFYDWMQEITDEFDNQPWMLTIPGRFNSIIVSSPEFFEEVMSTKGEIFQRGSERIEIGYDMFGNGITLADGDAWYYHRKTASNLFSMQMMREVMQEIVREKLEVLVGGINGYIAKGKQVSYPREIGHFTMDVFTKIGFGIELHNLEIGFEDAQGTSKFNKAFNEGMKAFGERITAPVFVWKLKKYFNIGSERKFSESMAVINKLVVDVIDEAMAAKQRGDEASSKSKNLVSLFLDSKIDESDVKLKDDPVDIMRDMVVNFITAGKDSSAIAMTWFCVNMNRHPRVLVKIRDEMRAKVPGLMTGEVQVPTVEQVNTLVYLEAAIRENLRLFPVTFFIGRIAREDTVLHDGTFVPKGTDVTGASWMNARNKKSWGEDAREFKPERWIDPETGKLIVVSPFKFSTFGSGQHNCLGQKFALMEIKLAMATLWSKFDFKTVEVPEEITYEFSLTIPVKGPLNCVVTPLEAARAAVA